MSVTEYRTGGPQENLLWGIRWGLRVAVAFSAVAFVTVIGRALAEAATVSAVAWTLGRTLGLYLFGAIVSGGLVGLLRPLARSWVGSMFVGFVASLPLAFGGFMLFLGPHGMTTPFILLSVILALIWGSVAGTILGRDI